jgi:hypothetical protein
MKATFGLVSLLIALAIIGIVINKQLKAVGKVPVVAADGSVSQGSAASGTVREQSQQLQEKVRSDVVKALEQGAAQNSARQDDAGK